MIARHDDLASGQTDHGLVREKNLFQHLLFIRFSATAVAQIMLCTCSDSHFQIILLKSFSKRNSHDSRQIRILAI